MKKIAFVIGVLTILWVYGRVVLENNSLVFSQEISQTQLSIKQELESIDQQLGVLKDRRNMYRARAYNNDLNAERWQFESNRYLDARQAWKDADDDRKNADKLQLQIDTLEKRKEQILQDHPEFR